MSTNIDEKIVQMRFDNQQFESGIRTSTNSVDELNRSLKSTESMNVSPLGYAVESISAKFSALQVMAVTALANITNSAVNAGKRIVSALTIDPISSGFSEYETQINAVQTILANTESKGKTITDVMGALDELNKYADKTIYNFTEMTRNIGTFTAAGVDLDTSVAAIKGIANLAAVSGSTSQQASVAMYQLSQALSSGTVKLMDWNSLVNAGMGGQVLQDSIKETARVHGIAIDDMIESEGSFRETLSSGWLTAEIMLETLQKFTGDLSSEQLKSMGYTEEQIKSILKMGQTANDAATKVKTFTQLFDTLQEASQSGWTQTWEIIVGDFEEAKVLLTSVSDTIGEMINASAEARNETVQGWKDLGGRAVLIDAVRNAFEGIMSIVKPIKEAFAEIFPPITAKQLYNLTEGLKKLTENFKISSSTADKLKRIFKGLFAFIDIGIDIISAIAKCVFGLIKSFAPAGEAIFNFAVNLGDAIVKLRDFLESGDVFNKVVNKIKIVLDKVKDSVQKFVGFISKAFSGMGEIDTSGIDTFVDKIQKRFKILTVPITVTLKIMELSNKIMEKMLPLFLALADKTNEAFCNFTDNITEAVKNNDWQLVFDIINSVLASGLIVGIRKFFDSLTGALEDNKISGFMEGLAEIKDGIVNTFGAIQENLKAKTLLVIATAIGTLVASLVVLSFIDPDKLGVALAAVTTLFIDLFAAMSIFSKIIDGKKIGALYKLSSAMTSVATAVLILSFAMLNLAKLDWEGIGKGLTGVAALSTILVASAKVLSSNEKKLIKGATGLVLFATSILILTEAVEKLGSVDIVSLGKGLLSVGVLMGTLVGFMKATDGAKMGFGKGLGLVLLATSIVILSSAVDKLGSMPLTSIGKGLLALGGALGVITGFLHALPKKIASKAWSMVILATAISILASALTKLGKMSITDVGNGLLALAGSLGVIVAALYALPEKMAAKAGSLVTLAISISILASALTKLGKMSIEAVGRSLLALAGSLGLVVGVLRAMPEKIAAKAWSLVTVSIALGILANSLEALGSLSLSEIGIGLLALAGTFVVLGAAGYLLQSVAPTILTLAGALALIGIAVTALGAGIFAISVALTSLAGAGTAVVTAIVAIVSGIISLIPMLLEKIAEAIVAFCGIISRGAPAIGDAVAAIILMIAEVLIECSPAIFEALGVMLNDLFNMLIEFTPKLFEFLGVFFKDLFQFIIDIIPPLLECVGFLLEQLLAFILEFVPKIVDVGLQLIVALLNGIAKKLPDIIAAGVNIIVKLLEGIGKETPRIVAAGIQMVVDLLQGIADGIMTKKKDFKNAAISLIEAISEAVADLTELLGRIGYDIVKGIVKGMSNSMKYIWNDICSWGQSLVDGFCDFFGIHSPSRLMRDEVGRYIAEGVGDGLVKYADSATDAATYVGEETMDSLSNAISNVADVIDGNIDASPTIRPVLDLSQVQNDARQIDSMFGNRSVSLAGANSELLDNNMRAISEQMQSSAKNNNSDVVDALSNLRNDFGELINAINNMKIVMDSGTVVGELIDKIDSGLGQIAVYKGRGN